MTDLLQEIIDFCTTVQDRWRPGAMYPQELAWLLFHIKQVEPSILIECGRQDGVSTEVLAAFLEGSPVRLISIDLDLDTSQAYHAKSRLKRYPAVECISGDVHVVLPQLLVEYPQERLAIVQDAAKGWEGLSTLLSAAIYENVSLIAQHNLHKGHITRELFQYLAFHPCYIENSDLQGHFTVLDPSTSCTGSTRPRDHSSLGIIRLDRRQREAIANSFEIASHLYGPWNPSRVLRAWRKRDYEFVPRMSRRVRFSIHRYKRR